MTENPTCPTCRAPLQWFLDANLWGCDRCRVTYPPSATPERATPPAPGRRSLIWVAAGAVALLGGGIAIAVATGGGGGKSRSATSVNDAVARTFAALGAGDAEALLANADPAILKRAGTCTREDPERDKREDDDMRKELQRAATREKGAAFEVLDVTTRDTQRVPKGRPMGNDCTAKLDIAAHKLDVKLKATRAGTSRELVATMMVMELDGAFLVLNAPKLPGCSTAIARAMLLAERAGRASELTVAACERDKWSDAMIECVADSLHLDAVRKCVERG